MSDTTLRTTPSQLPVITDPVNYAVTLYDGSDARHRDVPCLSINPQANAGIWHEFVPFKCDLQKCRLQRVSGGATGSESAAAFLFHYARPEDLRKP